MSASNSIAPDRDYELSPKEFNQIRSILKEQAGIDLAENKRELAYSRLARRVKELGLPGFPAYLDRVAVDDEEMKTLINAMTTNFTSFFRERHHFEYLSEEFLPYLWSTRGTTKRLRLWCAGCSTGNEPYTLAMTILDSLQSRAGWDIKILATDLDTNVLEVAKQGVYPSNIVKDLPNTKWLMQGRGAQQGMVAVKPQIRQLITFKQLNLMHSWPMRGPFDVIFCRNVVIYFDAETKANLVNRFEPLLADDGRLFMGHSESLSRSDVSFELCGRSVYRKANS